METKAKSFKFNVYDIVTISRDYKKKANLVISQPQFQVYEVMAVNPDDTISLEGVWPNIPQQYIEGVPIKSNLVQQIFYDTNHARHYEPGKIYEQDDIYSRPYFMKTMEERLRNTSLWEDLQAEDFFYVHELQHWLTKHYGYSWICINQFWGMRKPLVFKPNYKNNTSTLN